MDRKRMTDCKNEASLVSMYVYIPSVNEIYIDPKFCTPSEQPEVVLVSA